MQLKNFYINCEIDGRKSKLAGGPKAEDGGFNLTIYQRSEGKKIKSLSVIGTVQATGRLRLEILKNDNILMVSSIEEILTTER